jgi:hypothetical protein
LMNSCGCATAATAESMRNAMIGVKSLMSIRGFADVFLRHYSNDIPEVHCITVVCNRLQSMMISSRCERC